MSHKSLVLPVVADSVEESSGCEASSSSLYSLDDCMELLWGNRGLFNIGYVREIQVVLVGRWGGVGTPTFWEWEDGPLLRSKPKLQVYIISNFLIITFTATRAYTFTTTTDDVYA